MDPDRPPERWSWLDAVGWLCGLWPALKERLHRWLHKDRPECPDCARHRAVADEWAERCRRLEALPEPEFTPGRRLTGPVTDAQLAVAYDTLLTGQTGRLRQALAPSPPAEPPEPSEPKRPLPPIMRRQHERSAMIRTGCRHPDGRAAPTNAEIVARAQEMVDAREAP